MDSDYSAPESSDSEATDPLHRVALALMDLRHSTAVGNSPRVDPRVHKSPTRRMGHGGGGALHDRDQVTPVRGSTSAAIPSVEARGRVDHVTAVRHIGTRSGVLVPGAPGSDFCAASARPLSDSRVDPGGDAVEDLVATLSQAHRRFGQDLEAIRARLSPPRSDALRGLISAPVGRGRDRLTISDDSQDEGRDAPRHPSRPTPVARVHHDLDDRAAACSPRDERRDALRYLSPPDPLMPEARRAPLLRRGPGVEPFVVVPRASERDVPARDRGTRPHATYQTCGDAPRRNLFDESALTPRVQRLSDVPTRSSRASRTDADALHRAQPDVYSPFREMRRAAEHPRDPRDLTARADTPLLHAIKHPKPEPDPDLDPSSSDPGDGGRESDRARVPRKKPADDRKRRRRDPASSPDGDSSPEPSRANPRAPRAPFKKWLLPEKYDGTTPLAIFLTQMDTCAAYNKWDDADKLAHMRSRRWLASGAGRADPQHAGRHIHLRQTCRPRHDAFWH